MELSDRVGREKALVHLPGVEIVHFGRVSSRQNVTYAAPNLMIGYVRYLRKSGVATSHQWRHWTTPLVLIARMPTFRLAFENAEHGSAIDPEFAAWTLPLFEGKVPDDPYPASSDNSVSR